VKIISWNVNGLRSVLRKGFVDYLDEEKPDILCVQEIKCRPDDVEKTWPAAYRAYFHPAEKPGYAGTAMFCKKAPLAVEPHVDIVSKNPDKEGRILTAELADFFLVNVYVPTPSATSAGSAIAKNGTTVFCATSSAWRRRSR